MHKPLVSIVIVSYNVKEFLQDCLYSLIRYSFEINYEVIIVDNASTDGTIDMLNKKFPAFKVIANRINQGFPAANNQAFRIANGKYIFMLNPDTLFIEDALRMIVSYMELNLDIFLLGPRLLNEDKTIQRSIQRFITVSEIIFETFYLHHFYKSRTEYNLNKINSPIFVEALSGAAIFFRVELLDKIGYLDEDLFWTEDMEFCYRSNRNGFKALYFPDTKIVHYIGASGKKDLRIMISNQILTKINFFKKNHSKIEYMLVLIFRLLHIISRLIVLKFLSIFNKMNAVKAKAYSFTFKRFILADY
jgi:N-acetylglucosaminyl-diphospho-decaprenol L-rhamnosyltransferase